MPALNGRHPLRRLGQGPLAFDRDGVILLRLRTDHGHRRGLHFAVGDRIVARQVLERDLARLGFGGFACPAQQQRQVAHRRGEPDFLRLHRVHFERDRFGHRHLGGAVIGDLIDRQHARVLQHHLGGGLPLVDLTGQHHVDMVARQHEAADAADVVDADGDRLHALAHQRRERRALAGAGDLEREHRLVGFHRGEHHAAAAGQNVVDLAEGAGRQRLRRPGNFLQHRGVELGAETQRLRGDHDGLRGERLFLRLHALRAHVGLVVEPDLRDEHGEQAEHDREADHNDGTGTHGGWPRLTRLAFAFLGARVGAMQYPITNGGPASGAMLKGR